MQDVPAGELVPLPGRPQLPLVGAGAGAAAAGGRQVWRWRCLGWGFEGWGWGVVRGPWSVVHAPFSFFPAFSSPVGRGP